MGYAQCTTRFVLVDYSNIDFAVAIVRLKMSNFEHTMAMLFALDIRIISAHQHAPFPSIFTTGSPCWSCNLAIGYSFWWHVYLSCINSPRISQCVCQRFSHCTFPTKRMRVRGYHSLHPITPGMPMSSIGKTTSGGGVSSAIVEGF